MPQTAVTETRSWVVRCRRNIVAECPREHRLSTEDDNPADPGPVTSTAAATERFRAYGWVLHSDGTASCPVCLDVWNGRKTLDLLAVIEVIDDDHEDHELEGSTEAER